MLRISPCSLLLHHHQRGQGDTKTDCVEVDHKHVTISLTDNSQQKENESTQFFSWRKLILYKNYKYSKVNSYQRCRDCPVCASSLLRPQIPFSRLGIRVKTDTKKCQFLSWPQEWVSSSDSPQALRLKTWQQKVYSLVQNQFWSVLLRDCQYNPPVYILIRFMALHEWGSGFFEWQVGEHEQQT